MGHLTTIGRVEQIDFLDADLHGVLAKVDTGAYRSSVWATNIHKRGDQLSFTLLGGRPDGEPSTVITTTEFKVVQVENSFGHKQKRYSVFLRVKVGGKTIRSNFTLANRANKTYPVLLGRKMLKNRFLVDVSGGVPIADEETHDDESLE